MANFKLSGITKAKTLFFLILIAVAVACVILFYTMFPENSANKIEPIAFDSTDYPKTEPLFKVHFFNYTNFEEYLNGQAPKLILEDVGPYVYREEFAKTHREVEDNLMTYRESRTQTFLQHESGSLTESDKVIVPHLMAIGALEAARATFLGLGVAPVKNKYSETNSKVYKEATVNEFLWGYEDAFVKALKILSKQYSLFSSEEVEDFGMFRARKGISKELLTVYTGEDDVENKGRFYAFNRKTVMKSMWKSDNCNKVDGSDGSQFPTEKVKNKEKLEIFFKDYCRRFPLVFDSEITSLGNISAFRYKQPREIYSSSNTNLDNRCYEINSKHVHEGLFLDKPCQHGISIFISNPHFLHGDKKLSNSFEGLNPNEEAHGTRVDIHPKLATPIDGHFRFQYNILVEANTIDPRIKKDIILPVLWIEVTPSISTEQETTPSSTTPSSQSLTTTQIQQNIKSHGIMSTLESLFPSNLVAQKFDFL